MADDDCDDYGDCDDNYQVKFISTMLILWNNSHAVVLYALIKVINIEQIKILARVMASGSGKYKQI